MLRDLLLLGEMIQAAERAHHLADGFTLNQMEDDRMRTPAMDPGIHQRKNGCEYPDPPGHPAGRSR